uniref:Uncharacterized protein n=1 Tax=Setaria digitata TaxID=48799 RepID=A0A915PSB7_9BILA
MKAMRACMHGHLRTSKKGDTVVKCLLSPFPGEVDAPQLATGQPNPSRRHPDQMQSVVER